MISALKFGLAQADTAVEALAVSTVVLFSSHGASRVVEGVQVIEVARAAVSRQA